MLQVIKNVVFWVATFLVSIAIILVALPMIGHLDYLTIISGSMEPEIPIGSLVIIGEVKDADIRIGDVVTFESSGEKSVTHKVIGFALDQNAVVTHGVANDEGVNEITPYDKIIGRVVFSIPFIGRFFLFISTQRGKVIAATVIIALYIISVFFETLGSRSDDEEDEEEDEGTEIELSSDPKVPIGGNIIGSVNTVESGEELGSWLDGL